jgi:hypothetical protein
MTTYTTLFQVKENIMAKGGMEKHSGYGMEHGGDNSKTQLHITAGGILTPVIEFRAPGITGTPLKPEHRGFPGNPGDEAGLPKGASRKHGGNSALKAFGLNGSGSNEK